MRRLIVPWLLTCLTTTTLKAQDLTHPPAVVSAGTGSQSFVLITGMVGGVAGFRRFASLLLARDARVIIIDPYALSLDSADVTFAAMARRVDAVLERYGVSNAYVIGHSHGGGVGLRLAAMASGRVAALYILDSGALPDNRGPTLSSSLRLVPIITKFPGGRGLVRGRFLDGIRASAGRREWLDAQAQREYTEPLLGSIGRVVEMAFRLSRAQEPESLSEVLARVHVPVTVILGAAPHAADPGPEEMVALAQLGSHVRVERLAGVGHFPHEESPNELLSLVVASQHVVVRQRSVPELERYAVTPDGR